MVEISNYDIERVLQCLDIAIDHYKSLKGLRNSNHAWALSQLKEKINRKIKNNKTNDKK